MATITSIFHQYLMDDANMGAEFGVDSEGKAGVYHIEARDKKQPYATIWNIDDPKDDAFLCAVEEGQTRYQCDVFTKKQINGINKREVFKTVVDNLQPSKIDGFDIYQVEVINEAERGNTVNGLFQFSFEAILHWSKY